MTYLEAVDVLNIVDFIQQNTLIPCAINNDIEGYNDLCFWDGIKTTNGTLTVNPDVAHPGDLLHEAGHLAILPVAARTALSGDNLGDIEFTEAYQACFAIDQRLGYATDSAATGWGILACIELGLDLSIVFANGFYTGEGEQYALTAKSTMGKPLGNEWVNDLYYLGMVAKKSSTAPLFWDIDVMWSRLKAA
jgi:hypothetical protein